MHENPINSINPINLINSEAGKILICEDEENIVSFLKTELEFEGFTVNVAFDGLEAFKFFKSFQNPGYPNPENSANSGNSTNPNSTLPDLILLDIMLPERNGLECLREIRKTSQVPVIILTARKEVYDKVAFLNAGADDYVTKPFDTMELIARIKRHISRAKSTANAAPVSPLPVNVPPNSLSSSSLTNLPNLPAPSNSPNCSGLFVDSAGYRAEIDGRDLSLTKTEFEILQYLHANAGTVKTREEIIRAVLGEFYGESNIIDANIKNIRAKMVAATPATTQPVPAVQTVIETVRGKGYVIRK